LWLSVLGTTMLDKRYPGPENIHRQTLPNGITVLAYENFTNPTIVVEGVIRTGALQDSSDKAGLASFTADMLLRGTQQYDYNQVYEQLESVGASLGFGSGRHVTQFAGHSLIEDIDLLLDLMAQGLRSPIFPGQQVERLRGQIQTNLQIRANDTQRMAALTFMETLYKDHPYGRSIQGYPETIVKISTQDLADFHAWHYGPLGLIIIVVGAIEAGKAVAKISSILGDWENPRQKTMSEVSDMPRPVEMVTIEREMPGKTQSDLILGLPGPRRSAPDYLHASLMNTVLGVFGMMGRIGHTVREEQGLAYYASSHLAGGLGPSPWTADAGTAPENVSKAIAGIKQEIMRIQTELVTPSELDDCKSYRIGSLPVGLETNAALANTIVDMELFGLGLDFLQRFPDLIRNISAEQLQLAAQKYLSTEQLVVAVAGPQAFASSYANDVLRDMIEV